MVKNLFVFLLLGFAFNLHSMDYSMVLAERNSNGERASARAQKDLSLSDLKSVFHLPINKASKELDVCCTVIKRVCRNHGILRWPHRKIEALNSLAQVFRSHGYSNELWEVERAWSKLENSNYNLKLNALFSSVGRYKALKGLQEELKGQTRFYEMSCASSEEVELEDQEESEEQRAEYAAETLLRFLELKRRQMMQ